MSASKAVAIVAAHFPPSNLAAVHRSRLWVQHLAEFGWEPIVLTTHWDYYEEPLDWDLFELVSRELTVLRTRALPTKPIRLIGDIGIRGFYWHYKALADLARRGEIDFVHITIPSNYSALLGRLLWARHRIPYGIDYIDPWIPESDLGERFPSKLWISMRLAEWLEPWAVRRVSLISGVAPGYYESVLERHSSLRDRVVTVSMPYGGSSNDFDAVRDHPRAPFVFEPSDGLFHMVYAGVMWPKAERVLERLLQAVALAVETDLAFAGRFRLHFIGTGKRVADPDGYNILPVAERLGVSRWVTEHPHRMGYVDVLNHLTQASAVLIFGSMEPHYTPSKVFQAVLSGRPVFALLHQASTGCEVLEQSRAGMVCGFDDKLPTPEVLSAKLREFVGRGVSRGTVDSSVFEEHTARSVAAKLASAFDRAIESN